MRTTPSEYDYIVVGAGSAGCVVARRLVDAGHRVVLVENGGPDTNPAIHDPGRSWELWESADDYAYVTEPQLHAGGREVFWPRGRVLGGSSALNGMIYVRGHRSDYDAWAADGATGWSYDEVLPYFKRSEDFEGGASRYHGTGGPLPVTANHDPNPVSAAFVEACAESGIPRNDDCNAEEILGAGLLHRTIRDGRRVSAWTAFLQPILGNPLLTVLTSTLTTRVLVEGGRAVGVEVLRHGERGSIRCTAEVILSAGTIGSPQILMLSGIGPADDLRRLHLPVAADLPGVGANLHDHLLAPVVFASANPIPPAKANKLEAQFFAKTDPSLPAPDIQPLMSHTPLPAAGYTVPPEGHGYTILAGGIRPRSRGRLTLRTADPAQAPVLDPRYLADPTDVKTLITAITLSREIATRPALTPWHTREVAPGPTIRTPKEITAYINQTLLSYHHQVGTCRMGSTPTAVVDPRLRVHGIAALRVADASVMPTVPSGNTHAPSVMVGERCADFLLEDRAHLPTSATDLASGVNKRNDFLS